MKCIECINHNRKEDGRDFCDLFPYAELKDVEDDSIPCEFAEREE